MGSSRWDDGAYKSRVSLRAATKTPTFAYTSAINSGAAPAAVHPSLDPKKVAGAGSSLAGQNIRECRDSAEHPTSNAVAVLLDVTGSMSQVPEIVQQKLVALMGLLLTKSYLSDPAILIGAIGDATSDRVPLQLGQFESGIEIENDLTNLFLEGNGGGQKSESYELGLYFLTRKTALDCLEKRGKKGYAFIIGDEMAYTTVRRTFVKQYFGDTLEADIPLETIIAEVQEKYDLYFIMPNLTNHYNDAQVTEFWKSRLGQNFIKLDDPNGISELLATLVGAGEGTVGDIEDDLKDVGTSMTVASAVSKAVANVTKGKNELTPLAGTGLSGF